MPIMKDRRRTQRGELPQLTDDREYAAESEKLQQLKLALRDLEQRLDLARTSAHQPGRIVNEAESLLGTEEGALKPEAKEDLGELQHWVHVHREAVAIQERRVDAVRGRVNRETIAELLPSYTELLRRQAAVALELGKLVDEEQAFRDALVARGFSAAALRPCPLLGMGLKDKWSRMRLWLAEIAMEPHKIKVEV